MCMTRKCWVAFAASVTLVLAALLWWMVTENDRRLDAQIRQALERYEQAFARDGVGATPTPPRREGYGRSLGVLSIEKVTVHKDGQTLTVEFVGALSAGACGADYTARAVESEHAVLIVVEEHPHVHVGARACTAVGILNQVTVRLSRPLGERAVLEAERGMPVPSTS